MADLPVVDPLQMTLEEFVERYVVPYYRAKWEAGADEFDRRTCHQAYLSSGLTEIKE